MTQRRARRRPLRVRAASAICAAAALLVAIALYSTLEQVARSGSVDLSALTTEGKVRTESNALSESRDAPVVGVTVVLTRADPVERSIQASISMVLDRADAISNSAIVDSSGRFVSSGFEDLPPAEAQLPVTLRMSSFLAGEVSAEVPLQEFLDSAFGRTETFTIDLPTEASPHSFPNDAYFAQHSVSVTMPTNLDYVHNGVRSYGFPVIVGVATADQLGQWKLSLDDEQRIAVPTFEDGLYDTRATVAVNRPASYYLFVYSISLTPLLLAGTFVLVDRTRRADHNPLELGAALIALLALRQVFVPSEIQGVTILDRLLGLQILLIVVGLAITSVLRTTDQEAPTRPAPPSPLVQEGLATSSGAGDECSPTSHTGRAVSAPRRHASRQGRPRGRHH